MDEILALTLWASLSLPLLCAADLRAAQTGCKTVMTPRTVPVLLVCGIASACDGAHGIGAAFPAIVALASSGVCAASDIETGSIYNQVTGASLLAAFAGALLRNAIGEASVGAAACGGALLFLHIITGRRGIGLGDVKVAAVIGAGTGAVFGAIALGVAFVTGAAVAILGIMSGGLQRRRSVPFGPYLAFGTVLSVFVRLGAGHA
jgi:prepilin signal peptidase PulO-like enzyme (type II secretory pathway)